MPVDASIPLSFQMPQFLTPMQAQGNALTMQQQLQSTQLGQMKLAEGQRNMRNQILLSQIGAKPGSIDKTTGMWTDDAIGEITQVDPMLAQTIRQNQTADKYKVEQLSLERSKALLADQKAKSEAINDEQIEAIAAADTAPASQREEVYAKKWAEGRERLKKTGLFPDETRFADMSYKQAKEIALRRGAKENKNPVQQVEEARDVINDLKEEYTHMDPNTPQAKQMLQKINDGEAALRRMTAPTDAMVGSKAGKYTSIQQQADGSFIGMNRITGEMEKVPMKEGVTGKDRRDVLQADALSAYRAKFPMGYFPDVYKDQPTPEEYVSDYIKNKESGGKGIQKPDEVKTRFDADPAMKSYKVGKKTPQGYEVLDKDGRLIGHYQ